MKQTFTKLGGALFALLFLMPSSVKAQTTLASWDFTKKYTTTDEGTSRYYTPSSAEAEDISSTNFSSITPYMYPNVVNVGNQSDYTISGGGSSWDIGKVNNEAAKECFRIRNFPLNSFDDITNKSTHNNWFEISFPTTGYKDIKFNIDFYFDLNEVAPLEYLISLDGGTTWVDGGNITSYGNWWMFKEYTNIALGVANQTSVKLRLVGKGSNNTKSWGIRTFSIVGTAISEETFYTANAISDNKAHGSVICSPVGGIYESGSTVTVTASNKTGWKFVEWQKGGVKVSDENPYVFTINENTELTAIYEIAPIPAGTEITAASWTFDTGYNISGNIYTPNESEWEEFSQVQSKNNNAKVFNANTAYGALTAYEAKVSNDDTGKTYYSINNNNGDKIFSLYPSGISNSITDYTKSAEHKVYFQFSFPTAGLKDISVTVEFTYGGNAVRNLELVYSTDGGTTWVDGGACAGGVNWYTYATVKKDLSADNKSNVIVRLLPANGEDGDYRMNSFRVSGTIDTTPVSISEAKYATYYNSIPVQLPANLQAATIDNEAGGTLTLNYRYGEGDVIPGGTPVLLKASAADTYNLTYVANDVTAAPAGNLLHGSDVATTTTGGEKYYALQYGTGSNASKLGFYWVNADGAAFTSGAHKAWLALPASTLARFFSMDDETTGVQQIESAKMNVEGYYNLAGQRVAQPQKGLYIVNGKKVVIK